jgi:WD40 repeat protein
VLGRVEVLRLLEGHKMDVTKLAFHRGHLYSGSNDGTVRTWYVGGGDKCPQHLHLFEYPMRSEPRSEGEVRALGLHPASKRLYAYRAGFSCEKGGISLDFAQVCSIPKWGCC